MEPNRCGCGCTFEQHANGQHCDVAYCDCQGFGPPVFIVVGEVIEVTDTPIPRTTAQPELTA